MLEAIDKALREANLSYKVAPADFIGELRRRIDDLLEWGSLSQTLYQAYSSSLEWGGPERIPVARTLVVIAGPAPCYAANFQVGRRKVRALIPPTYVSSTFRAHCRQVLEDVLAPAGFGLERPRLPVKQLAVRTGLGEYGRNDLCYVPGMGSFARLEAFVTDADLLSDAAAGSPVGVMASAQLRMERCSTCSSCHWACPTHCIPADRSLVDAERCLTYLNENERPWPVWLDPAAHSCLVGCMGCQQACPVNRPYLADPAVIAEFDEAETGLILENLPPERLPEPLRAKLTALDLLEYSKVLGRNLLALAR